MRRNLGASIATFVNRLIATFRDARKYLLTGWLPIGGLFLPYGQRIEFLYQDPRAFAESNRPEWLGQLKTEAGFAKIAGVELTLFDMCRYFHRAAGINGAAQAVHDLGKKASPSILSKAANAYENSSVRRLGYLLERFGYHRQAKPLQLFADKAKSFKDLDPAVKPVVPELRASEEKDSKWKLVINVPVEIDA